MPAHRAPASNRLTPRRRRLGAAVMLVVFAMSACKVDVHVGVRVAENGSGAVTARFLLDDEALQAIGGDLTKQLRVSDLERAGWDVRVEAADDGGAQAVAEKRFARADDLTAVIDELSGDTGPFRRFRLSREHSTFRSDFEFRGEVDLRSGIGGSSLDPADADVAAEIERQGVDVADMREFLNERLDRSVTVTVVVDLPGSGAHNAPETAAGAPEWKPAVDSVSELRASSSEFALDRAVLVGGGALLAVAAMVVWVTARRAAVARARAQRRSRQGAAG